MRFVKITYPECPVIQTDALWGGSITTPDGQKREMELRRAVQGNEKFVFVWIQDKGMYAVDILSIVDDIFELDKTPDFDTDKNTPALLKKYLKNVKPIEVRSDDEHNAMHDSEKRSQNS